MDGACEMDGLCVGDSDGLLVGFSLGSSEGIFEGLKDGNSDSVGTADGS